MGVLYEEFRLLVYPDGQVSKVYAVSSLGYVLNLQTERVMVGSSQQGQVKLGEPDREEGHYLLKTIVGTTFELFDEDYPYLAHANGDKNNCYVKNLIPSYNAQIKPAAVKEVRAAVYRWLSDCEEREHEAYFYKWDHLSTVLDPVVASYGLDHRIAMAIWRDELGEEPLYCKRRFSDRWVHDRIQALRENLGGRYDDHIFFLKDDFIKIDNVPKGFKVYSTIDSPAKQLTDGLPYR